MALVLALAGCASAPGDGCSEGYDAGYSQGWNYGGACVPLEASVECSTSGVDFCDYRQAYDHCFGVGFVDGYAEGQASLAEDCDVSVAPCSGGMGECAL
jgi:hypothetical protein